MSDTGNRVQYLVAVGVLVGLVVVWVEQNMLEPEMPGVFDIMKQVRWSLFGGFTVFLGQQFSQEADAGEILAGKITTGLEPF